MGGSSSSSSTQKSTKFNNMGRASGSFAGNINQASGASMKTGDIDITKTDHGATKQAGKTARAAVEGNSRTAQTSINMAGFLGDEAFDSVNSMNETNAGLADSLNQRSLETVEKTSTQAVDSVRAAGSQAMDLAAGLSDRAFDASGEQTEMALQEMQGTVDRSLAFANKSTRSENNKLAENLTKYGMYGMGALAVAIVLANRG